MMTDEVWIKNTTKDLPVNSNQIVKVKYTNGLESKPWSAAHFNWNDNRIDSYCVVDSPNMFVVWLTILSAIVLAYIFAKFV